MSNIAIKSSSFANGSSITGTQTIHKAGGDYIARVGDPAYCAPKNHMTTLSGNGSSNRHICEGSLVARVGTLLSCGHDVIVSGANDTDVQS